MSETKTQTQDITHEQIKEFVIKLINENYRQILETLRNYNDRNIYELRDKIEAYVKMYLGLFRNGILELSISFYDRTIEDVIKLGWSINDIKCEVDIRETYGDRVQIICETPTNIRFNIEIYLMYVTKMRKKEYKEYMRILSEILIEKYEKIINELELELEKCNNKLYELEKEIDNQ